MVVVGRRHCAFMGSGSWPAGPRRMGRKLPAPNGRCQLHGSLFALTAEW